MTNFKMLHWAPDWIYIELNIKIEKGRAGKWKVKLVKYVSYSPDNSKSESHCSDGQSGIND